MSWCMKWFDHFSPTWRDFGEPREVAARKRTDLMRAAYGVAPCWRLMPYTKRGKTVCRYEWWRLA